MKGESIKQIIDPGIIPASKNFDILLVCHHHGNVVMVVNRDHCFFRITDVTTKEPSRRPMYSFPLDSPEPIQMTIDSGKLLIWSGSNNTTISMKILDIFIEGKHCESGHQNKM